MINLINTQPGQTATLAQERVNFENLVGKVPQSQSSAPLRSEPQSIPAVLVAVNPSQQAEGSRSYVEPSSDVSASNRTSATSEASSGSGASTSGPALSDSEQRLVEKLSARDREVKQHEMAHKAAAGSLAGAMSLDYQRGPDGRLYAVGGEVSIRTSAGSSDPQDRLDTAEQVLRAATAPAEPSQQDLRVAAQARAEIEDARAELAAQRIEEQQGSDETRDAAESDETENEEDNGLALQNTDDEADKDQIDYYAEVQSQRERTASELQAYQAKLAGIQEKITEVNQKLTELGVLEQLYSSDRSVGTLVDETT